MKRTEQQSPSRDGVKGGGAGAGGLHCNETPLFASGEKGRWHLDPVQYLGDGAARSPLIAQRRHHSGKPGAAMIANRGDLREEQSR